VNAVAREWMADTITENEMLSLLQDFKLMKNTGMQSDLFMKDPLSATMLETSLWFRQYGIGPYEKH
jgi:hypothetical protein